jgi:NADH dehydrogenase [ubiquinone] 1 alpha subcomplex assembly factor 7
VNSVSDEQEEQSLSHLVRMYGPIDQAVFLKSLGIDARLESLVKIGNREQQQALLSGYKRLVGGSEQQSKDDPPGMGERYKAICIASSSIGPPVAFQD